MGRCLLLTWILAGLVALASCQKETRGKDGPGDTPPVVPPPPMGVTPPPEPPAPPPVVARAAEGLGKSIDHYNACVAKVADLVRATDTAPLVPAKLVAECEEAFTVLLTTRSVVVSEPYAEYFVHAARVSARLAAGADPAKFPVQEFIADYNAFALKNNDLMGVPVTDPPPPPGRRQVPRRTYRDELARLGEALAAAVRDWDFAHPFETLGSGAPAVWLSEGREERVRFWLLRLRLEQRLEVFGRIDCDNAGTGVDDKSTCATLASAGGDLSRFTRAWLDAWDALLASLVPAGSQPTAEARRAIAAAATSLAERVRELPDRIE